MFVLTVLFRAWPLFIVQLSFRRPTIMYEGLLVARRHCEEKWSGNIEINRPVRWMRVTNKRREMGNRAIPCSSLPLLYNGKIVTLEWACFATEYLPPFEREMIFFWDSSRVDWGIFSPLFFCSILIFYMQLLFYWHCFDSFVFVILTHHLFYFTK